MATQQAVVPINGNYAPPPPHDGYHPAAMPADDRQASHTHPNSTTAATSGPGTFGSQNAEMPSTSTQYSGNHAEVPKDEVGWYFVEQYYTNLSRCPDKLQVSSRRLRLPTTDGRPCVLVAPDEDVLTQTSSSSTRRDRNWSTVKKRKRLRWLLAAR